MTATTSGPPPAPAAQEGRSPVRELLERPLTSYYVVLGATVMLCALGLVMVLSASSVASLQDYDSPYTVFTRQLMWVAAGAPLLWVASRLPVVVVRRLTYLLLLGTLALLAMVQTPLGMAVNGNRNWLEFGGPFRLQPSELAKLALAVWGADLLARKHRLLAQWKHLLVPLVPVAALVLLLVLMGRDLGTSLVLMAITGGLLFFAGAPLRLFTVLGGGALALVVYLSVTSQNRRERLMSFVNPSAADPLDGGWQLLHSKYALGSGGWFGLGLGASREKWDWLPEQQTDFIFAVIGEELGLVGTVVVLALFAALAYGGFRIALRTDDLFVRLCAAAITTWIVVQAVVNVGAVVGVLPIAGVPLPLVSYGGSALLPTMLALGLLLCFARQERGAKEALAARGPSAARRALHGLRAAAVSALPQRRPVGGRVRGPGGGPKQGRRGRGAA